MINRRRHGSCITASSIHRLLPLFTAQAYTNAGSQALPTHTYLHIMTRPSLVHCLDNMQTFGNALHPEHVTHQLRTVDCSPSLLLSTHTRTHTHTQEYLSFNSSLRCMFAVCFLPVSCSELQAAVGVPGSLNQLLQWAVMLHPHRAAVGICS